MANPVVVNRVNHINPHILIERKFSPRNAWKKREFGIYIDIVVQQSLAQYLTLKSGTADAGSGIEKRVSQEL